MKEEKKTQVRKPSFGFSLAVLLVTFAFILFGITTGGAELALMFLLVWIIVFGIGLYLGNSYEELEKGAMEMAYTSLQPIMILLAVGAMVGAWIASGTVPSIYLLWIEDY